MVSKKTVFHPKTLLTFVLALVLIGAGVYGWTVYQEQTLMILSGIVQTQEIKNGSRLGGRVEAVRVQEGDDIQAGEVMVVFDNSELAAKLMEAEAAVTQAKAQYTLLQNGSDTADLNQARARVEQSSERLQILTSGARREEVAQIQAKLNEANITFENARTAYDNAKVMLREGIISQIKYNEIHGQYQAAESAVQAAKAQLQIARTGARPEEVSIARAELKAAQAALDKLQRGAKQGELDIAKAAIQKARSAQQALQDQLDEMKLKSPISGVVSLVLVTPGELIPPGRPVVAVTNPKNLWADVFVPESKLSFVRTGQPVTIRASVYNNAEFSGKVTFINPKSEFAPSGSTSNDATEESLFRVKVSIHQEDTRQLRELYPGMKIEVYFHKEAA